MVGINKKVLKRLIWLGVFLIATMAVVAVRLYYEYLQYLDIGYKYTTIFFTNLRVRVISLVLSFLAVFIIVLTNNLVLRRIAYKYNDDWDVIKKPIYVIIGSFLLSLLISTFMSGEMYENVLTFLFSVPFGSNDPLFGKDIGYYMFVRPFYMSVMDNIKWIFLLNIIYTIALYAVLWMRSGIGGLRDMVKNRHIVAHTLVNIMIFIVIIALGYKFNIEELMYKSFCGVNGAGATHMKIWYAYYKIAPFMLIVIVPLGLYFLMKKKFKRAAWTVASFPIVWVAAVVAATAYQTMFVDSNELEKEREYLEYNIQMTRKAYGLDSVDVQTIEASSDIAPDAAKQIEDAVSYVDISDNTALLNVYNSEQQVQNEYKFYDVDTIPYIIDGKRRTVSVSAREISDEFKNADTSYSDNKFLNTYGSGMVMTSSTEGSGEYFISGVPSVSDMGLANISDNKIHYGENENSIVVVNTAYDDENYIGMGGVQLNMFNRFVIGVCSGDLRLATNSSITSKSRALMNRNIVERVKKIAPFFEYDSDPYIVVDDNGVLKWVMDAYSVSDKYPYSQKSGNINYISPCAKVVIDAYSGVVDFYVTNPEEPMMKMYKSIYPYVFSDGNLPDSIKNYMRYPKDIFALQSEIYKKYHVDDVKNFYSGYGFLDNVKVSEAGTNVAEPWYTLDSGKAVVRVPYTQNGDNISAYLSASCEPATYGKLSMTFVTGDGFDSLTKVQSVISSSDEIINYINSYGKVGGTVQQGALRMICSGRNAVYAAPLYVTGVEGDSSTAISNIIVVMNGRVAVSSDIRTAVKTLTTERGTTPEKAVEEEQEVNLVSRVINLYNRVRLYQNAGDWENYGIAMKEFDEAMGELARQNENQYFEESFVGPRISEE